MASATGSADGGVSASVAGVPGVVHKVSLKPTQVLPLSADFATKIKLSCTSGIAEIDGFELAPKHGYTFSGTRVAVYTHRGCTLEIVFNSLEPEREQHQNSFHGGAPSFHGQGSNPLLLKRSDATAAHLDAAAAGSLPVVDIKTENGVYTAAAANLSLHLHSLRQGSLEHAPRVLILGPQDSGKSTLAKILANHSLRQGKPPMFVDLCPQATTIAIPGTVAAMPIVVPIDPAGGYLLMSSAALASAHAAAPIVYWYGSDAPVPSGGEPNSILYLSVVHALAESVGARLKTERLQATVAFSKMENEKRSKDHLITGGLIIDAPATLSLFQIAQIVGWFGVTHVIVISEVAAYNALLKVLPESINTMLFPDFVGITARDKQFKKYLSLNKIKEYFYGVSGDDHVALSPQNVTITPSIIKVGTIKPFDEPHAVSKFNEESEEEIAKKQTFECDSSGLCFNAVTDWNLLMYSILAVSSQNDEKDVGSSSVIGFVFVSNYNEEKKKVTMMIPFPGKLPETNLILGAIKWMELN